MSTTTTNIDDQEIPVGIRRQAVQGVMEELRENKDSDPDLAHATEMTAADFFGTVGEGINTQFVFATGEGNHPAFRKSPVSDLVLEEIEAALGAIFSECDTFGEMNAILARMSEEDENVFEMLEPPLRKYQERIKAVMEELSQSGPEPEPDPASPHLRLI